MELLENFVNNLDTANFIIVIILTIVLTLLCANYFKLCTFTEKQKQENFDFASIDSKEINSLCECDERPIIQIQQCDCDETAKVDKILQPPKKTVVKQVKPNQSYKLSFYYSNGCGYCKIFKPEWEKIQTTVSTSDLNNVLILESNDCQQNPDGCKADQQYIDGFPTILLTKPCGTKVKYTDYPRTHESVLKFLEKNM